ncbi:hydroperoxide isomerase ALOXE3-like [Sphaeramia orbicularis]|uniref:hydroperoxide isomerase ALOXE3-like n=1 Tax=Sphaeramia orbicularis TaxID=375764 RepID=UPI00117FAF20|nr:hydroperoxide isomerase ALOXE3-like [Sphaeramia orbicularis]
MAKYKVEVTTGDMDYAGTWDRIYVTLIGTKGQSERTELNSFGINFNAGAVETFTVTTPFSLGRILLLKLEKDFKIFLPENMWFCSKIVVTTPEGDVILFPCHSWMYNGDVIEIRGGRAMKIFEDDHQLLNEHRKNELLLKRLIFQFESVVKGLPHFSTINDVARVPVNLCLSTSKLSETQDVQRKTIFEFILKGMLRSTKRWENIDDLKKIFWHHKTQISDYVAEHWKEDEFYGFQFLNGANPNPIKRCSELPPNFAVTEEMMKPFLEEGTTLQNEMEKGNILIVDKKIMEGIPTRVIDGEPVFVASGFCLFYVTPEGKLRPIAIQLRQQPSETNPIFLPSDSETDWLLAKLFFKSADLLHHQPVYHQLNTHFVGESFNLSTMRNLPEIHPIYKLLIPHFRYSLYSNVNGRGVLFSPKGPLTKSSLGYDGLLEIMRRGLKEVTYTSLCLPDNMAARGLESVPNFYYRDDGLKLWDIVNRFVKAVIEYYYPSDDDVQNDSELQTWIGEIFTHGFLGNKASGIPESFNTAEEVIKFITMIIFNSSGQHATANHSQFDYYTWTPNGTLLLVTPPPTTKGQSNMKSILDSFPNIGDTVIFALTVLTVSTKYTDFVPMGSYPEERFDEPVPKQIIKDFQAELKQLSETIDARNSRLEVPYNYFNPSQIENSINV